MLLVLYLYRLTSMSSNRKRDKVSNEELQEIQKHGHIEQSFSYLQIISSDLKQKFVVSI